MKNSLAKGILTLICYSLATCHNEPSQKTASAAQPESHPETQEIILTRMPDPDLTDNEFNWAWSKVSKNHKLYKPIGLDEFKVAGLRRFQCRVLGECFVIVSDQKVKDTSRYKILVLYSSDYSYKRRNYKPYWVTCNHDLSRTSLWNSNIGVVAIEYLETGWQKVSVLKRDEAKDGFTCTEVGSFSLVYPAK